MWTFVILCWSWCGENREFVNIPNLTFKSCMHAVEQYKRRSTDHLVLCLEQSAQTTIQRSKTIVVEKE